MCGICGVHRFGDAPIQRDMVDLLVLHNQNRGLEATGVALQQQDGSIVVIKNDVTPFEFIASKEYNDFMDANLLADTVTVIGHTRKATKGTPRVVGNNHPMFSGTTAVVHNGQIHNDDQMFKEWKLDRKAETDSDIFRAILDKEGFTRKAVDMMARLNGNGAIAAISTKYPGKLLLGRSGNPIEIAATNQHLIWSSERGPLYKALRPYRTVYGILMREMTPINYYMIGMSDHSAWLFGEKPRQHERNWASDWVDWTHDLKIATSFTPVNYTCHAQYNGTRIKFYDDRPVDVVQCGECGQYMNVNPSVLKDLEKYFCRECNAKLG